MEPKLILADWRQDWKQEEREQSLPTDNTSITH